MVQNFSFLYKLMKRLLYLFITLILFQTISAQEKIYKWKQIPETDLKMEMYPSDPGANAVILQEYADIYFDVWRDELRMFYEVHRRIKILNQDGLKWATLEIPYIGKQYFEDILSLKAYVYNYENGKIVKNKLKHKKITTIDTNDIIYIKKISFPNVKVGSIIDYKYTLASLQIVNPQKWFFQKKDIPVRTSEFRIKIPDIINYQIKITGQENLALSEKEESFTLLNWTYRHRDPIPGGLNHRKNDFNAQMNFSLRGNYLRFVMSNIPAFVEQKYSNNYINYLFGIELNLLHISQKTGYYSYLEKLAWQDVTRRMYQTTDNNYYIMTKQRSKFVDYPSGFIVYNIEDWETLSLNLMNSLQFGMPLVKHWNYKPTLNKILKEAKDNEKSEMLAIYDYIRKNYKWNGNYNVFLSRDLETVFHAKKGTSAEINMLMLFFLKKAKLDAYPIIIKTTDKGEINKELPAVYQFNSTIAGVYIDEKLYLLDATNPERPYTVLSENDLNKEGRLIKRVDSKWVKLKNNQKSKKVYNYTYEISEKTVKCNSIIEKSGFAAYIERLEINKIGKEGFISEFEKQFSNISNIEYTFENLQEENLNIKSKISFQTTDILERKENSLSIFPIIFKSQFQNPFTSNYRNIPVNFTYPFQTVFNIKILIPDNYKIFYVPNNENINISGANFTYTIKKTELNISIIIDIKKAEFSVIEYNNLQNLFQNIETKMNEKIIFKK